MMGLGVFICVVIMPIITFLLFVWEHKRNENSYIDSDDIILYIFFSVMWLATLPVGIFMVVGKFVVNKLEKWLN